MCSTRILGEVYIGYWGKFLQEKAAQALERAAQMVESPFLGGFSSSGHVTLGCVGGLGSAGDSWTQGPQRAFPT